MWPAAYPEYGWSGRFKRAVRTAQIVAVAGLFGAVAGGAAVFAVTGLSSSSQQDIGADAGKTSAAVHHVAPLVAAPQRATATQLQNAGNSAASAVGAAAQPPAASGLDGKADFVSPPDATGQAPQIAPAAAPAPTVPEYPKPSLAAGNQSDTSHLYDRADTVRSGNIKPRPRHTWRAKRPAIAAARQPLYDATGGGSYDSDERGGRRRDSSGRDHWGDGWRDNRRDSWGHDNWRN